MIIIDTNVLSELMKTTPDPVPLTWLALHDARDVFTTAVSKAEILFGIRSMPQDIPKNIGNKIDGKPTVQQPPKKDAPEVDPNSVKSNKQRKKTPKSKKTDPT